MTLNELLLSVTSFPPACVQPWPEAIMKYKGMIFFNSERHNVCDFKILSGSVFQFAIADSETSFKPFNGRLHRGSTFKLLISLRFQRPELVPQLLLETCHYVGRDQSGCDFPALSSLDHCGKARLFAPPSSTRGERYQI